MRGRMETHQDLDISISQSGISFMSFIVYQPSLSHLFRLVVLPAQYSLRLFSRPEALVAA
jgi:hypothetical protein